MRLILCFAACLGVAACGDPIAAIPRLSQQDIPTAVQSLDAVAAPVADGESLMKRLVPDEATEAPAQAGATPERRRGGTLFGLFTRKRAAASDAQNPAAAQDTSVPASLPATSEDGSTKGVEAAQPGQGGGLFGIGAKAPPAVTSEIAPGTVLPYGKVARICGLPKKALGKKIAAFPERAPKHAIYDSAPGNLGPHRFYLTGFADGCARQFTASLAMFGTVEMHEQLRYGLPDEVQPYSDTDKAYEAVKSRVCGVPRKKPCGAKIGRLDDTTVFVSIYERFGSNPTWSNLLLHRGEIVAQDQKGG